MHKARLLTLFTGVLLMTSFSPAQTATGETLMLDLPRQSQHVARMRIRRLRSAIRSRLRGSRSKRELTACT